LPNTDEYLVPSTKIGSGVVYYVNSIIGTCDCFIGLTGALCKHQGAVAMKYHIRIINFLLSLIPNDHMTFLYIASELNMKDHLFYASLRTKPALINQHNTLNVNKNDDSSAITIANNEINTNNES
ncbi:11966_t:CDS:2, partial [Dentiscutata erythropus]